VSYTGKGAVIMFPPGAEKTVCLLNCQGKTVAAFTLKERKILVDRHSMANGIVYVAWKINGRLQPFSNIVLP
jgi:hypothetical protein